MGCRLAQIVPQQAGDRRVLMGADEQGARGGDVRGQRRGIGTVNRSQRIQLGQLCGVGGDLAL